MNKEKYNGYFIEIAQDHDPMNPRDWDNTGTMAFFHKRYILGDTDHGLSIDESQEIYESDDYISLPVYMYDHSGITINCTGFSCPWDSGQLGIIFCKKGFENMTDEQILSNLQSEVSTYDRYLRGDVYGYTITDCLGEDIESCCGFFGEDDCIEEAKSIIDHITEAQAQA